MTRDVYVYYLVSASHAKLLQARVAAMQAGLGKEYGVATALKRCPEEKDGKHTWMEVYLAVPDDFDAALQNAIVASDLATLIDGERHTEYFLDVSLCA